ncbi:MAG TPA: hypothetical protein VHT71_15105 [Methylomirabilota bacterium]|nr:hypothetical protein [Methylomirabilota bacterium]
MNVHVERLLGRKVRDSEGRVVGRLEEIHTRREGDQVVVSEWVLGTGGLVERLSLGPLLRGLLGNWVLRRTSQRLAWDALDLRQPERPRLRGPLEAFVRPRAGSSAGRRNSSDVGR